MVFYQWFLKGISSETRWNYGFYHCFVASFIEVLGNVPSCSGILMPRLETWWQTTVREAWIIMIDQVQKRAKTAKLVMFRLYPTTFWDSQDIQLMFFHWFWTCFSQVPNQLVSANFLVPAPKNHVSAALIWRAFWLEKPQHLPKPPMGHSLLLGDRTW